MTGNGENRTPHDPDLLARLVEGAQRGDALAMDELLGILAPYVGRICGPVALQDGADAAQEALIAVFRSIRQLKEPAALFGWVRGIAVREALKGVVEKAVWTSAAMDEFVRSSQEPGRARAGEALHRAFALRDIARLVLGRYKKLRLTTPTVILAGEHDSMLPPSVVTDAGQHADDLRVQVVAGCGHYLHEERPDLVAAVAEKLFSGRP